jgi:glycosyltransferase involved in cell wall biosynthesis
MHDLVQKCGLENRIVFSGWLSADEVSNRLIVADILLMTSTSEGLPMAGIEALRHGLAIAGSRIGGLTDLIDEGINGFFSDLEPLAFAKTLRTMLGDSDLLRRMREASLSKALSFNLPDRIKDYEAVLQRAASFVK